MLFRYRPARQKVTTPHLLPIHEASLVKRLEELGIGRPSTWLNYSDDSRSGIRLEEGSSARPHMDGVRVVGLLEDHHDLVDYELTAKVKKTSTTSPVVDARNQTGALTSVVTRCPV